MIESFIVRIYRRASDNTPLVGTVEDTRSGGKWSFLNHEDLWDILSCSPGLRDSGDSVRKSDSET